MIMVLEGFEVRAVGNALIEGDGLWLEDRAVRIAVRISVHIGGCIAFLWLESHISRLPDSEIGT